MTSFLVTNGTNPEGLQALLDSKIEPTQLYLTLPAPDENIYKKVCNPLIKDGWERLKRSLVLLKKFSCRKTIRFTLVKGLNMGAQTGEGKFAEKYAELLKPMRRSIDFFEAKAYMWVGYSRERLAQENMPLHSNILEFSKILCEHADLKIVAEKKESRVVLMINREDNENKRFLQL